MDMVNACASIRCLCNFMGFFRSFGRSYVWKIRALPPVGPAHTCWGFVIRHEGTNRAVKGRHHMNVQCS